MKPQENAHFWGDRIKKGLKNDGEKKNIEIYLFFGIVTMFWLFFI